MYTYVGYMCAATVYLKNIDVTMGGFLLQLPGISKRQTYEPLQTRISIFTHFWKCPGAVCPSSNMGAHRRRKEQGGTHPPPRLSWNLKKMTSHAALPQNTLNIYSALAINTLKFRLKRHKNATNSFYAFGTQKLVDLSLTRGKTVKFFRRC